MNDVDFPVARVLEGIDAATAAGPPGQGERRRQARRQRRSGPADGRVLPRARTDASLHRVHGRRPHERLAARRGRARRRDRRAARPRVRRRARRAAPTAARSPSAGATATAAARSGSSPPSRSPSAATAPGRASRPRASSSPASSPCAGTDLRALVRGGGSDDELARRDPAASGTGRERPLLRAALGSDARARARRDELHRRLTLFTDFPGRAPPPLRLQSLGRVGCDRSGPQASSRAAGRISGASSRSGSASRSSTSSPAASQTASRRPLRLPTAARSPASRPTSPTGSTS